MKSKPEINKILNKKIVDIRGFTSDLRKKRFIRPQYLLFEDKKTIIELEEQDYYSYRDCSSSARFIRILVDKRFWKQIKKDIKYYPKATMDI